jgi:hypothetical protein
MALRERCSGSTRQLLFASSQSFEFSLSPTLYTTQFSQTVNKRFNLTGLSQEDAVEGSGTKKCGKSVYFIIAR